MQSNFLYQKKLLNYLLIPASYCYRLICFLNRLLYRLKIKKTNHFPVPVIIVGNITAGGTGKTPFVIWLTEFLISQGFKPGVVSRGYGGKAKNYPHKVNLNDDPKITGDEPLLIAQKTNCPVIVDPNRSRGVEKLLTMNCNIIISDDGLQHHALGRSLEIVLIDEQRKFGNGFYLPAGPLRESVKRLKTVDFVISNGSEMILETDSFVNLKTPENIQSADYFNNKKIHAVAGIGNPQRFFDELKNMRLQIIEHSFPDHYDYKSHDLNFGEDAIVIMTEKDAVKCLKIATDNYWCLPVKAKLPSELIDKLLKKIQGFYAK